VLRSLTKTWGLAGLRIGYVLADAERIAALGRAQPLWAVSTPGLTAIAACMEPAALAQAAGAAVGIAADRGYLLGRLGELADAGVEVAGEPAAPFVLVRLPGAAAVRLRLRDLGFAVRRADTFPGLGPDWLRLAVRDPRTTDRFAAALAKALAG
jgi:histidinol-phosphate aminotransferase